MEPQCSHLARASFIFGIISMGILLIAGSLGILFGLMATLLGVLALQEKDLSKQDRARSIWGIVFGALPLLSFLAVIVVYGLLLP